MTVTPLSWRDDLLSTLLATPINSTILLQTTARSQLEKHSLCAPLLLCCHVSMLRPRLQSQGARWVDWMKQSWETRTSNPWEYLCQALLSTAACKEVTSDVFYHENLHLSISWPHPFPSILASSYLFTPNNSHGWQGKGEPAVKSKSAARRELGADVLALPLLSGEPGAPFYRWCMLPAQSLAIY